MILRQVDLLVLALLFVQHAACFSSSFSSSSLFKGLGLSKKVGVCVPTGATSIGMVLTNCLDEPGRATPAVAGSPIPRLYVYDHCPFCVRTRFIMGIKKIKHDVIWCE